MALPVFGRNINPITMISQYCQLIQNFYVQLREYYKGVYHGLSKFDWSVFLNLKPLSYFLAFIWLGFLSRIYWSSLDQGQLQEWTEHSH